MENLITLENRRQLAIEGIDLDTMSLNELVVKHSMLDKICKFQDAYKTFNNLFNSEDLNDVVYDITKLKGWDQMFETLLSSLQDLYDSFLVHMSYLAIGESDIQSFLMYLYQEVTGMPFAVRSDMSDTFWLYTRQWVSQKFTHNSFTAQYPNHYNIRMSPHDMDVVAIFCNDMFYYYVSMISKKRGKDYSDNQNGLMQSFTSFNCIISYLNITFKNIYEPLPF